RRKPWQQAKQQRKPRRGDAVVAVSKRVPYDQHLLSWRPNPCAALSGLSAIWTLNPGLAPWAVLLDPFGVLGFAPETSLARCVRMCADPFSIVGRSNGDLRRRHAASTRSLGPAHSHDTPGLGAAGPIA